MSWSYTVIAEGRGVVRRGQLGTRLLRLGAGAGVALFCVSAAAGFAAQRVVHAPAPRVAAPPPAATPVVDEPVVVPAPAPAPAPTIEGAAVDDVEPASPPEVALAEVEDPAPLALDRVVWTTDRTLTLRRITRMWGVSYEEVQRLNPWVDGQGRLPVGTELVVFEHEDDQPTRSLGAPNRGRLVRGMPMPEGAAWAFRSGRRRMFGTRETVESLFAAFSAYAEAFPDGPAIRLGDMSHATGGPLKPHRSHQSGRDVDINFVLVPDDRLEEKWRRATIETFDAEKNWFLFKHLVDTENVQLVLMAEQPRDLLWNAAMSDLRPDDAEPYFRAIEIDARHRDHMHVRFQCPEIEGCYPHSVATRGRDDGAEGGSDAVEIDDLAELDADLDADLDGVPTSDDDESQPVSADPATD